MIWATERHQLNDLWSKKICRPKMIVWSRCYIHPLMILFFHDFAPLLRCTFSQNSLIFPNDYLFFSPAKMGKHSQQTSGVLWHLVHTDRLESRKMAKIMGQCWYIASNTTLHFWLSDICIFGVNVLALCYVISTEGALRRPMTYDNHPIPSHPFPHIALKINSHVLRWTKLH